MLRDFDFLNHISPKRVLSVESRKSEHHHEILHIQVIFDTKFQFQLKILTFSTTFDQKGYYQS